MRKTMREASIQDDTTSESNDGTDDESMAMSTFPLVLVTFSVMLTLLATEMDRTIVSTIVPTITSEFNSLDSVGWFGGAYLLVYSSFLPALGQIYIKFEHRLRWVFLSSLIVFETGSTICAASTSASMFIVGRAVAGFGGAGAIIGGWCIITEAVPLRRRALYYSLVNSMTGVAALVGPPLGGIFVDKASWRWCFWINLPLGAITATLFILVYTPKPKDRHAKSTLQTLYSIDILGSLLLTAALVCLFLALQSGGSRYSWKDPRVFVLFIMFGLLAISVMVVQYIRGDHAVIPPRILKIPSVAMTGLIALLLPLGQYVQIYFLPVYFQASLDKSASGSGLLLIAYLLSDTFAAVASGATVNAWGRYKPILICGTALFTAGSGCLYALAAHHSVLVAWIFGQIPSGAAMGMSASVLPIAIQAVLPPKDHVLANTMYIFLFTVGGTLGSNVGQAVFSNTLNRYITYNVPGVDSATVEQAGAAGFMDILDAKDVAAVQMAFGFAVSQALIIPIATGGVASLLAFGITGKNLKTMQKNGRLKHKLPV